MIKRILTLIFIFVFGIMLPAVFPCTKLGCFSGSSVFAADSIKINSINFDNSDSIIFLATSGIEPEGGFKITKSTLTNPGRVFFDIENAVITFPNSTFDIKNSKLQKVRIAQNSVNPNIVRIVVWNSPNYDTSKIKVLKIKNNIIIKLNNETPLQQYQTQIYRETKDSASDYYEKTVAVPGATNVENNAQAGDEIFNKVQKAFNEDNGQIVRPNIEQKQAKLQSRYFLDKVYASNGNLIIAGIGVVNAAKPFNLTNPSRIVFDLPNTVLQQNLKDKEIKLSETASAKLGQFTPSTARIVIKTASPQVYTPIYSSDLQTLLFAEMNNLASVKLNASFTELSYFKEQNVNSKTNVINITFTNPVFYSIVRENNKISLIFYNLVKFNIDSFNLLADSKKNGFEAKQLASNVYKISFPLGEGTLVDGYETLNAKQLRFVFTKPQPAASSGQSTNNGTVRVPIKTPEQMKKEKTKKTTVKQETTTIKKNSKQSNYN